MQTDDTRLKEGYRKVIQVTTFLLFPSMLLLAALAESLFKALLPAKWLVRIPLPPAHVHCRCHVSSPFDQPECSPSQRAVRTCFCTLKYSKRF